jgi:WD40 repeat protein
LDINRIEPMVGSPGGDITIFCSGLDPYKFKKEDIRIGNKIPYFYGCSKNKIKIRIPRTIHGEVDIEINNEKKTVSYKYKCSTIISKGLFIIENPAIDKDNNIYTTSLDKKNKKLLKTIIKIDKHGNTKTVIDNIPDVTSLAFTKNNDLLILSREEGNLYISDLEGKYKILTINLGKSTGIVVDSRNNYFVGNVDGEVYKINLEGNKALFVKIPKSFMSYHMTIDSEDNIYLTNPNQVFENKLYKVTTKGEISEIYKTRSLLKGLTAYNNEYIYFIETKRGVGYLKRINLHNNKADILSSGENLIGVALNNKDELVLASNTIIQKVDLKDFT